MLAGDSGNVLLALMIEMCWVEAAMVVANVGNLPVSASS